MTTNTTDKPYLPYKIYVDEYNDGLHQLMQEHTAGGGVKPNRKERRAEAAKARRK